MPDHSFWEEIFPNIQSKPPLTQVEVIASRPIPSYLGEETNTHLTSTSCQVVVESKKKDEEDIWSYGVCGMRSGGMRGLVRVTTCSSPLSADSASPTRGECVDQEEQPG